MTTTAAVEPLLCVECRSPVDGPRHLRVCGDGRQFGQEDVRRHTLAFCAANPAWMPIFQLKDEALYSPLSWKASPGWLKRPWRSKWRELAPEAFEEFCTNRLYAFRNGYVSGAGRLYECITHIPWGHNGCMVIEIGGRRGFYRAGFEFDRDGKRFRLPEPWPTF